MILPTLTEALQGAVLSITFLCATAVAVFWANYAGVER